MLKPLTLDQNKLWKTLQKMGLSDHLTCLLRNPYMDQEATFITLYGTTDWFKTEKGVWQGYILSLCLFNLYAKYIMWNAKLDEPQAGLRIAGRNINNLRYENNTTLMAASEEEIKSILMIVKEETEKAGFKLNIQDHSIWSYYFIANRRGKSEKSGRFYFLGLQNHCRWWLQPCNLKDACSLEGKLWKT